MATGVKPRDDDISMSMCDIEVLEDAFKKKEFRKLLADYCEEVTDPANQELYQKEITQLEKERGMDVKFINPKPGYVIKTSVAGDRKAFINICASDTIAKPRCSVNEVDGRRGLDWEVPYSIVPPREDYNFKTKAKLVIYDVVFHPDTLRLAENNRRFRELVNNTAFEGLMKTYDIKLDQNNSRFPRSMYKGMVTPSIIRKEDPDFKPKPDDEEEGEEISPEILDKLYPQRTYCQPQPEPKPVERKCKGKSEQPQDTEGFTTPKYVIKQQKTIDLQDYTYNKESKQHTAIPSQLVVEINLPLIASTADCNLDVCDKKLTLLCEKPARYKLNLTLPYSLNEECGSAKFDQTKRLLIVTLPVKKDYKANFTNSKFDSGVESDGNSPVHSDDDTPETLVVEISSSSTPVAEVPPPQAVSQPGEEQFLDPTRCYIFPPYTLNVLETTVAFTFHVKNTEPDSLVVKTEDNKIYVKFTTIGAGYVPVYYTALLVFPDCVNLEDVSGEAWDNNVILQVDTAAVPQLCHIGLDENSLTCECLQASVESKEVKDTPEVDVKYKNVADELPPMVQVANFGNELNIKVSSSDSGTESSDSQLTPRKREIRWSGVSGSDPNAKGILRKPRHMGRSFSESSMGEIASSVDMMPESIPEGSSLKKTVRFSNVIAKQFYRHNSSIEGQKKKNQRKKSKKRNQERRKSESEAEEERDKQQSNKQEKKAKPKITKERRDSGLADTSDPELEAKDGSPGTKFEPTEPVHNTEFYDPKKLNKGQYLEVNFKNDLIFDLDM